MAAAADPAKVLRVEIPRSETGFDPMQASEIYSGAVIAAIMEPLLTFDYLARPVKVIPLTAVALPEITDGGKTYTFRVKESIFFADDPAFKGKRRELTADDYAYAIKRLVDPANRSPNAFYVAGKIGRAIFMAYSNAEEIEIIRKGQATSLQMPIPPGVVGYSATYRSSINHDSSAANKLLDRMGYRKGPDGYRSTPDGKPLVVRYSSQTDATARDYDELWKKALDSIPAFG